MSIKENAVWYDRKRILGLPISFTKYYIADNRLYIERGFLKTELDEILLYRILDIKTRVSFWQKLFGVGTIIIHSVDKSTPILELKNIKHVRRTHRLISNEVEVSRDDMGIAGKEIIGSADEHDCDC